MTKVRCYKKMKHFQQMAMLLGFLSRMPSVLVKLILHPCGFDRFAREICHCIMLQNLTAFYADIQLGGVT